jgi:hypothetical protein
VGKSDAQEIKARLAGQWQPIITALCRVDPSILDGKHHPCPKCGGEKRFNLCREGTGASYCNDCPNGPEVAGSGIDTIMWLNGWDYPRAMREIEAYLNPHPVHVSDDSRKIRHETYLKLASIFGLHERHKNQLIARKLPEVEIARRGYWSLTGAVSLQVMKEFPDLDDRKKIGEHVPGVFAGGSMQLAATNCMLIPVRSRDGRIEGLQYRPDKIEPKQPKYRWFSSSKKGVSSGSPCHFAMTIPGKAYRSNVIRLTEGPLKADIANTYSDIKTIAVAGVNSWQAGVTALKEIKPEFVYLAFDMDSAKKAGVAGSIVSAYDALLEAGLLVQLEVWDDRHNGLDDALVAGATVEALPIEETKKRIDYFRNVKKELSSKKLRNFKLVPSKSEDPNKAWDKEPLLVPDIAANLLDLTDGWPKACGGQLFVVTEKKEIRRFTDYSQLFGWISSQMPVGFSGNEGCLTKKEFYSQLPFHVEQFADTEEWPHFPLMEGNFYAKTFEPGDGSTLEKFLDFFSPATSIDRELILAFVATTFWGGSPGRRVCFGIDSIVGTGAGKSELVKRVAKLSGGNYEFDAKKIEEENLRKQLVNGQKHRVALLDNVKESCLSSSIIESLVTSDKVAGHRLHVGYGSRPNTITWAITMNGMALSRDLAQRTVIIKLNKPKRSGTWDDDMDRFIAENHESIIADIAAFFLRPQKPLSRFTRWASWERAILSRLKDPESIQALIEERSVVADEDHTTAESINEFFEEQLRYMGYDPIEEAVHIPAEIAREWLVDSSGKEFTKRSANSHIKQLLDGGSLRNLKINPSRKKGRGWIWNFGIEPVNYTLEETFKSKKYKEGLF